MSYLQISNKGEISPHALSLMGASTKRGDAGKIGFFGTGNKYALSRFLRDGLDVVINSGEQAIDISTRHVDLDGESFSVVLVDGQQTSITTDMGPTWALWQAIREVYSNALDSGDADIDIVDEPEKRAGYTNYCIEASDSIQEIMRQFDLYFSTSRTAKERHGNMSLYEGGTGTVYRHGIRCVSEGGTSLYDYEVGNVNINEERLANYGWQVGSKIWKMIFNSDDQSVIANALNSSMDDKCLEGMHARSPSTDFPSTLSEACKEWLKSNMVADQTMVSFMSESEEARATFLPMKMMSHFIVKLGKENLLLPEKVRVAGEMVFSLVNLSGQQLTILKSALSVISQSGISISYPITAASFGEKNILGWADAKEQRIVLSENVFSMGVTIVVAAILEEWIHLKHGVKDETRAMQDAIFNEFSTVLVAKASAITEQAA